MKLQTLCVFLIVFYSSSLFSQSYVVHSFQSEYDTLEVYASLTVELLLEGEWGVNFDRKFDFGFDFPFFDSTFTSINLDSETFGYFGDSPDYNMAFFSAAYELDGLDEINEISDTNFLHSDFRYSYLVKDGLKAFVIEYHNVYESSELYENGPNHFVNLQLWFFENGMIELHFGEIDLDNCSRYIPGFGFVFDLDNPFHNGYGPWIFIENYHETEEFCYFGDHENPTIISGDDLQCDVLTSIPPKGFVIQFTPADVALNEVIRAKQLFSLHQNKDQLEILGDMINYTSCSLFDIYGNKALVSDNRLINIAGLIPQIYICVIETKYGNEIHKIYLN